MNRKKILKGVIRAAVSAGKKAGETANRIGKPSVGAGADKIAGRVKKAANTVKEAAFIPIGLAYFKKFFDFPDKDIPILGIGAHRNFFTHSAAPVFLLSMIYTYLKSEKGKRAEIARKLLGKVAGYSAFGLGLHLLIDTASSQNLFYIHGTDRQHRHVYNNVSVGQYFTDLFGRRFERVLFVLRRDILLTWDQPSILPYLAFVCNDDRPVRVQKKDVTVREQFDCQRIVIEHKPEDTVSPDLFDPSNSLSSKNIKIVHSPPLLSKYKNKPTITQQLRLSL